MADDTEATLFATIRPLFRRDALVQKKEMDGGLQIGVAWRLGEHRMDNWSREIRLIIPREVVERYGKLNEKGRFKANANLVSFIRLKLESFRPEHDKPRYLLPPVDLWPVRFEDIFPR